MIDFNAQNLAIMAWAFAAVKQTDEKLFTASARAAGRQMSDFKQQNLANTVWAFATVNHPDDKLFTAVARTWANYG